MDAWQDLSLEELEREYSPSSCVENLQQLIETYIRRSEESESQANVLKNIFYGEHQDECLDIFPATEKDAPLMVFIHGGYWQELSKNESTFAGADFVKQGIAFAAINYSLAPTATIDQMIEQCYQSVIWLYHNAAEYGFSKRRIYISGSSAGAHLAAMVVIKLRHSANADLTGIIRGSVLISGVYDLRPLVKTYINQPLGLNNEQAVSLSPLYSELDGISPVIVCWGDNETSEFKRQSKTFAGALEHAKVACQCFEMSGYNHFDIVHALANPATRLGEVVTGVICSTAE